MAGFKKKEIDALERMRLLMVKINKVQEEIETEIKQGKGTGRDGVYFELLYRLLEHQDGLEDKFLVFLTEAERVLLDRYYWLNLEIEETGEWIAERTQEIYENLSEEEFLALQEMIERLCGTSCPNRQQLPDEALQKLKDTL